MSGKLHFIVVFFLVFTFILFPEGSHAEITLEKISDKISISGQVRVRPEFRKDLTQAVPAVPGANEEDLSVLLRTRIGFRFMPTENLHFFIQGQDSRDFGEESSATPNAIGDDEGLDLHQGYVDYRSIGGSNFNIRVGRQEINFGEQRLVGAVDWSNFGRSFDGGLFYYDSNSLSLSLMATVSNKLFGTGDTQYFGGIYGSWKKFPGGILDVYYLLLQDNDGAAGAAAGTGDTQSVHTVGTRINSKYKKTDFGVEGAVQLGKFGSNSILAYAAHAAIGYTFEQDLKSRIALEYNFASGDSDTNNRYTKFNNLFGTEHNKYGLIDIAVWSNMHDGSIAFGIKPGKFQIYAEYHLLMVDQNHSTTDTFGGFAGAAGIGKLAGHEADLTIGYNWNEYANFLLGYSHFIPGSYFKDRGINTQSSFVYLQAIAQF